jgi:hypothetical protein
MHGVAADAGQIGVLMLASRPIHALGILVTSQAGLVSHGNRRGIRSVEHDGRQDRLAGGKAPCMGIAGSVAGFAAMLSGRRVGIALHRMRGLEDLRCRGLVMALHARRGAMFAEQAVACVRGSSRWCCCSCDHRAHEDQEGVPGYACSDRHSLDPALNCIEAALIRGQFH